MVKKLLVVGIVSAIGVTAVRAQQPQTAEQQVLQRMAQEPRNLAAQLDLIRIYLDSNRLAEAELLLTRALAQVRERRVTAQQTPVPAPPAVQLAAGGPVRIGGDVKEPLIIRKVPPVYPPIAQSAGVEGIVIIEALIETNGTVREAKVLRSQPLLDEAAIDSVRQWVFTPTLLNGAPVQVIMTVTVNFSLK